MKLEEDLKNHKHYQSEFFNGSIGATIGTIGLAFLPGLFINEIGLKDGYDISSVIDNMQAGAIIAETAVLAYAAKKFYNVYKAIIKGNFKGTITYTK